MGLNMEYINGQTPLDETELEGLLIPTITTRGELDEFEQQNIEQALQRLVGRRLTAEKILTEQFVMNLHKRMYGEVWSWAGSFRQTDKNLGIDKWQVPSALKILLDDTVYWINNKTMTPDEIAISFKHRIVSIHCFSNGNGRHSRLMADIIIEKVFGQKVYTWGAGNLVYQSQSRTEYLRAVRAADKGDIKPLIMFAKS